MPDQMFELRYRVQHPDRAKLAALRQLLDAATDGELGDELGPDELRAWDIGQVPTPPVVTPPTEQPVELDEHARQLLAAARLQGVQDAAAAAAGVVRRGPA